MTNYSKHFNTKQTPQSEPAPGKFQVQNNAGGYTFRVTPWQQLDRWLIIGTEGGTYYTGENELTVENAKTIKTCLKLDGKRTVDRIAEVSDKGLTPSNDPAVFALALAASDENSETRKHALQSLPKVCRIGTHLFHFAEAVDSQRGWGRSLKNAIANWYTSKEVGSLAHQVLKYQARDGWSHRDLLRLSHPKTEDKQVDAVFRWITQENSKRDWNSCKGSITVDRTKDKKGMCSYGPVGALPKILENYTLLLDEKDPNAAAKLIRENNFTHEMVPGDLKNHLVVWEALLERMPITAMVRNLGKMTEVGLIVPGSEASKKVACILASEEIIKAGRVHPIQMLNALNVYSSGQGSLGKLTWSPDRLVVDALDEGFYKSFNVVVPTGKRILVALDVSGSMAFDDVTSGKKGKTSMPGLTPRTASAAMAMVTTRTESEWEVGVFDQRFTIMSDAFSRRRRLDDVVKSVNNLDFGLTDCSLPMQWALKNGRKFDAFYIYTDNETYYGEVHPHQALVEYRQKTGINAKLIVNAMSSAGFSVADPDDPGMLDVVGLDSSAPAVMADFIR